MCRREGWYMPSPGHPCLIDGEAILCDESGLAVFNLRRSRRSMLPPSH
jgi:hypothetical protein